MPHRDARDVAELAGTYKRRSRWVGYVIAIVLSVVTGLAGGVTGALEVSDDFNLGSCAEDD
jgi:hypothetical protein